jgi:diphosphomevalonate decarboxylase
MKVTAKANSNIALIKYWGKRDAALNLPAVGSISLTLDGMVTETSVEFISSLIADEHILNGESAATAETQRVAAFLNIIRQTAHLDRFARVISSNNFPTAAGLASSASAFAALALAATKAAGLDLPPGKLSELARRGSGSAARSVFGGFVEMHMGQQADGSDSVAEPLADKNYWDIRVLIAVTSAKKKKIGSTDGMTLSRDTCPYYQSWVESSESDLAEMRRAIHTKDFQKLGEWSEFSCLKMHALAIASNPGLLYWNGVTLDGLHLIRDLRHSGQAVYFTVDAGPQIKAICLPEAMDTVKAALENLPGITRIIETSLGDGARIVGEKG